MAKKVNGEPKPNESYEVDADEKRKRKSMPKHITLRNKDTGEEAHYARVESPVMETPPYDTMDYARCELCGNAKGLVDNICHRCRGEGDG